MRKITNFLVYPFLLLGMFILVVTGCKKKQNGEIPTLTTIKITEITDSSAVSGGNITSNGGANITSRGICWSTGQTPTIQDNIMKDGIGTESFKENMKALEPNTNYYVRAFATNSAGTGYGNTISFTTLKKGVVYDIEGNEYKTVQIGNQVWMAENLRTTKYNDGTLIPLDTVGSEWAILDTPAYCWYNNDSAAYALVYGALYNWHVVNTNKLCPVGWHVPTDAEWTTLTAYIASNGHSGTEGAALKATNGWSYDGNGTDNYGFAALPGGYRSNGTGSFYGVGSYGVWWSATESNSVNAWQQYMGYNISNVFRSSNSKQSGMSVRCVKN